MRLQCLCLKQREGEEENSYYRHVYDPEEYQTWREPQDQRGWGTWGLRWGPTSIPRTAPAAQSPICARRTLTRSMNTPPPFSLSLSQTSCCYSERKYKHLSSTVSIVFVWYRERRKKLVEVWYIYIYRYRFIIKMNIIIINFYYLLCYYYYLKFGMGKGKGWSSSRWLRECVVVRWTISWIGFVGESGSWVVVCVQMKTVNGESPNLWILISRTFRLLTPDKHVAHINHHHNHNHNLNLNHI